MPRTPLAILLALLLLLAACGDGADDELSVDDLDEEPTEDVDEEDDSDEEPTPDPDEDDGEDDADDDPEPDPARVADPCAEWQGKEMESFLDVVAPVDGQSVTDTVEMVGCANVPEGTVRYRVTADDGTTVADDFTTAECGGPCVGEYRTEVDLAEASSGQTLTLEVFWDSPADGSEQNHSEVEIEME